MRARLGVIVKGLSGSRDEIRIHSYIRRILMGCEKRPMEITHVENETESGERE